MWFHLTDKATGAMEIVASLSGYDTDLYDIAELEREPGEFEDVTNGKLVRNLDREADTKAGPEHIAESHRQKRWEATLIKMGLTPPDELSVLKGEAANRGITLEAMADIIAAKSAAFVAAELARQEPDIAAQKLAEGTKP